MGALRQAHPIRRYSSWDVLDLIGSDVISSQQLHELDRR